VDRNRVIPGYASSGDTLFRDTGMTEEEELGLARHRCITELEDAI